MPRPSYSSSADTKALCVTRGFHHNDRVFYLFKIGRVILHCPFCSTDDTKVIDSRLVADGNQIRRRRECASCHERFTTYEIVELLMPRVIKQDGSREPFDESKLRSGLNRALEKRPVSIEAIESALNKIKRYLRNTGEREISALIIGEQVMEQLRKLDEIAYVRFASVYRRFTDISEFQDEINRLQKQSELESGKLTGR